MLPNPAEYRRMHEQEQRADTFCCDDADWIIVACNTPARMAKGAVQQLRKQGVRAGLFRPITLWPFPIDLLLGLLDRAHGLIVVEGSNGQLEDEMRLALSHSDADPISIDHIRHFGGILPSQQEIVDTVSALTEVAA